MGRSVARALWMRAMLSKKGAHVDLAGSVLCRERSEQGIENIGWQHVPSMSVRPYDFVTTGTTATAGAIEP